MPVSPETLFRPESRLADISNCFSLLDSDEERLEIQRAYEKSEGKLAYVMKMVPFLMPGRDEERVIQIIQGDNLISEIMFRH